MQTRGESEHLELLGGPPRMEANNARSRWQESPTVEKGN